MGYNLTNEYIDESFQQLTQISGSVLLDGTGSRIDDLSLTSSHAISSSYAVSSSHTEFSDNATSASYAVSSSHSEQADNATNATNAVNATNADNIALSADNVNTNRYVPFTATANGDGTLLTDAGLLYNAFNNTLTTTTFNGDLTGNASTANSATSASHAGQADNATSASFATTASFALNFNPLATASYAVFAESATSASYAVTSSYPLRGFIDVTTSGLDFTFYRGDGTTETIIATITGSVENAVSASHALFANSASQAVSSSYAVTASYALNVDGANVTGSVTNAEFAEYANNTIVYGKNLTGAEILKGTPLFFTASGTSGNTVGVYPADAGNPARMPAGGIAGENIAIGGEGRLFLDGFINGVDTSAFNSGDVVYVAVGGGYTNVKPTGSANLVQSLGYVEAVDASNGSGVINGPGISTEVPNIAEGNLWVGNSDGVATPSTSQSLWEGKAINVASVSASSFIGDGSQIQNVVSSSYAVSSSLSQLAVNLTSGDKDHSGTIDQQFSAPGAYQQKNLATISGVTYNSVSYPISELTYMNYGAFGPQFENALAFSQWDGFSYTGGAELLLAPQRIQFNFTPQGGPANAALMGMQPNGTDSQLLCYATELQLGQFRGVTINLGNRSGVAGRQTENLNINAVSQSIVVDEYSLTANTGVYVDSGTKGGLVTITNNGASPTNLDLNEGNFFTLDLTTASTTLTLDTTGIKALYGQTFQIKVTNTTNSLSYDSNFKYPGGVAPVITANGTDILTGVVWGDNDIYLTKVGNFF